MTFRARRYKDSPVYHCWLIRDGAAPMYGTMLPASVEALGAVFRGAGFSVEIEEHPLGAAPGEENVPKAPTERSLFEEPK